MTEFRRPRPALLCILDGWGHRVPPTSDNAISQARTPNIHRLMATSPHALIGTPQQIADAIGALGTRSVVEARFAARPPEGFRPAELVYLSSSVPATLLLSEVRL